MIEGLKLAFSDAYAFVADPLVSDVPTEALLNKDYLAIRRSLIDPTKAMDWPEPEMCIRDRLCTDSPSDYPRRGGYLDVIFA